MTVGDYQEPGWAGEGERKEELPPKPQRRPVKQLCYLVFSWFSYSWGISPNVNTSHTGSWSIGFRAQVDVSCLGSSVAPWVKRLTHTPFLQSPVSGGAPKG